MDQVVPHSPKRQPPELDPSIAEGLDQWHENMPLGVQPTMQEPTGATRSLANGKAVGPDGVYVELFKISTLNGDPALRQRILATYCRWYLEEGGARSSGNIPSSLYSTKRRTAQSAATAGPSRWTRTPTRYC